MIKVSVVVTTYNRADLLDKTLASLAAQTRQPDELIISDDCSPDHTAEVANRWKLRFNNFRYSRNVQNLYMPGNLNAGISLATGEYIANLHDADLYAPTMLQKWEKTLDIHPTAGMVFNGWSIDIPGGQTILHKVPSLTPGRQFFERYYLNSWNSIIWGTVMTRRTAYNKLLPFDSTYGFISDVDLWMRMCFEYDIAYVNEALFQLDYTPTKERGWIWKNKDAMSRMKEANIRHYYANNNVQLKTALSKHKWQTQWYYLRGIQACARRGNWMNLKAGLPYCRKEGGVVGAIAGIFGAILKENQPASNI